MKKILLLLLLSAIFNESVDGHTPPSPASEGESEHINLDVYSKYVYGKGVNYGISGGSVVNINDDFGWGIQIGNDVEKDSNTASSYVTGVWHVPVTRTDRLNIGAGAGLINQGSEMVRDFLFELYYKGKEKNWSVDALFDKEGNRDISSRLSCDGTMRLTNISKLEGKFDAKHDEENKSKFSASVINGFELYPDKTSAEIQLTMEDWNINDKPSFSFSTSATTKFRDNSITASTSATTKFRDNAKCGQQRSLSKVFSMEDWNISVSDELNITKSMKLRSEAHYGFKDKLTLGLTLNCDGIIK